MPLTMPLVGPLSSFQENAFRGVTTQAIDPSLRPGRVTKLGEFVKSKPLVINGESTRWAILGKYDLVAENEDGTVALIDCKVSDSPRDSGDFYSPQLHAYTYALEMPATNRAVSVASMGLLVWKPNRVIGDSAESYGFGVAQSYVPIERNERAFITVMADFISVLEGPCPDSGSECPTCKYLTARLGLED